jgi:hypothetical protein
MPQRIADVDRIDRSYRSAADAAADGIGRRPRGGDLRCALVIVDPLSPEV